LARHTGAQTHEHQQIAFSREFDGRSADEWVGTNAGISSPFIVIASEEIKQLVELAQSNLS
jgi:hypothetical protein